MKDQYKAAGVDIEAGYEAVNQMKSHVQRTMRKEVLGGLGSFGAAFDLGQLNMKHPILVSGTDGVGTKLKLAIDYNKHTTIGIDAVAMCVNDILTTGAEPLYFLDYLALNKVEPDMVESIVAGVSEGCVQAGCALIGGETAEMGDMYDVGDYDVAGFAVGAVEKDQYIQHDQVKPGQKLIGLPSSGIHSNGYSLVRKIMKDQKIDLQTTSLEGKPLIDVLLEPTKIYVKPIQALLQSVKVYAMSHITGGGFIENIPRMLPEHVGVNISTEQIKLPAIFNYLQHEGNLDTLGMYDVFNMGIGFVVVVDELNVEKTVELLRENGEEAVVIGEVTNEPTMIIDGKEIQDDEH